MSAPWNVLKIALVGTACGAAYFLTTTIAIVPGVQTSYYLGGIVGGAIGGGVLFGVIAAVRNFVAC